MELRKCTFVVVHFWLSLVNAQSSLIANATAPVAAATTTVQTSAVTSPLATWSCPLGSSALPGSTNASSCLCDPGFQSSGLGACTACKAGSFKAVAGLDACEPCPEGFFSEEGSSSCPIPLAAGSPTCLTTTIHLSGCCPVHHAIRPLLVCVSGPP
eukprot:2997850-Rhodomonas_salina.1